MNEGSSLDRVPSHVDLMKPTFTAILGLGGSGSIEEIANEVVESMGLSSDVTQVPHGRGSQTKLENRLGWARTYLKKYGLIDNSQRGVWSLTAAGRNTKAIDPREVARAVVQMNAASRRPGSEEGLTDEIEVPVEDPTEESTSWREDLLSFLQGMSPDAFERLCQRILRESGFIEVEVTGRSGDGGIDGHGIIRLAGLISFPVLFQSKRHTNSVSASVVRDFRGAMIGRAEKGVILTTGTFTRGAQREATRDGAPPIDLIDGELLIDRLKDLELGITVSTRVVEDVAVNPEFFRAI